MSEGRRTVPEVARVIYNTSVARAREERPGSVPDFSELRSTDASLRTALLLAAGVLEAFPELRGQS